MSLFRHAAVDSNNRYKLIKNTFFTGTSINLISIKLKICIIFLKSTISLIYFSPVWVCVNKFMLYTIIILYICYRVESYIV